MMQPVNELQIRIFEETESIIFNVISERSAADIPMSNEVAYKTGYEDALIDAKIYFRMIITRILGEKL
jgi:hypothetical protein